MNDSPRIHSRANATHLIEFKNSTRSKRRCKSIIDQRPTSTPSFRREKKGKGRHGGRKQKAASQRRRWWWRRMTKTSLSAAAPAFGGRERKHSWPLSYGRCSPRRFGCTREAQVEPRTTPSPSDKKEDVIQKAAKRPKDAPGALSFVVCSGQPQRSSATTIPSICPPVSRQTEHPSSSPVLSPTDENVRSHRIHARLSFPRPPLLFSPFPVSPGCP